MLLYDNFGKPSVLKEAAPQVTAAPSPTLVVPDAARARSVADPSIPGRSLPSKKPLSSCGFLCYKPYRVL